MSDIVWAVDPTKDHLSDLSQRMRRYISDVCTARQIEFRFDTPAGERDLDLGANIRREVFLLFKEGVANMVRHSGCSRAALEFRQGDGELLLRIADNGRGFDPAVASEGHGLRSMQERTAALGGHFAAISAPGRGTILTFRIPIVEGSAAAASAVTGGAAT
jgi:signal transduction histidine kinase